MRAVPQLFLSHYVYKKKPDVTKPLPAKNGADASELQQAAEATAKAKPADRPKKSD